VYSVKVEGHFSSAHNLRGYKGKCESLHGHNWKVEAEVRRKSLDKTGMVMDFKVLRQALKPILDGLDHTYLNKTAPFDRTNPTSENIARFIYVQLEKKIPRIYSVTVWENETCSATYSE